MEKKIQIIDDDLNKQETYGINASNLIESDAKPVLEQKVPKKRGGRSSSVGGLAPTNTFTDIVTADKQNADNKRDSYEKKVESKYHNQVGMIAGIINQTDAIMTDVSMEIQKYRDRPGYGGKGRLLAMNELQQNQISLLNTKLAAVRELNSVATKINELCARHDQQMKEDGEDASDRNIMRLYE